MRARGVSTRTPNAARARRASGTSRPAACARIWRWPRRARRFDSPPDVQEALEAASAPERARPSVDGDSPDTLKAEPEALDALAERGYYNERQDQLVLDVLLGLR